MVLLGILFFLIKLGTRELLISTKLTRPTLVRMLESVKKAQKKAPEGALWYLLENVVYPKNSGCFSSQAIALSEIPH